MFIVTSLCAHDYVIINNETFLIKKYKEVYLEYNLTTYPYLRLSVKILGGGLEVQSYNLSLFTLTVVSKDSR